MIKARIKDDEYHVPTKWSEITYRQYVDMNETDSDMEVVSIASGIPAEIIEAVDDEQLYKVVLLLGFLNVPFSIEGRTAPEEILVGKKKIKLVKDIREKTFGQKIYFGEIVKQRETSLIPLLTEIVSIYTQPYFDDSKFDMDKAEELIPLLEDVFFVDLYSTAISYLDQLKKILDDEAATLTAKPDQDQITAGVDMFQQFGVMNTVKALANNDVTKYAEVLEIEYNTVFVHMRMNKVQNDFNDNYSKVLEQKRKSK